MYSNGTLVLDAPTESMKCLQGKLQRSLLYTIINQRMPGKLNLYVIELFGKLWCLLKDFIK